MTFPMIPVRQNGHLLLMGKAVNEEIVAGTVQDLTKRAVALMPTVADLAREVYELRWDVDDALSGLRVSDELVNYQLERVGIFALDILMFEFVQVAAVAIDGDVPYPAPWLEADQRGRCNRRHAANQ